MADPLYRQIAEDLRRKIKSGALPPGSQLPTELELRDTYGASRNTIRDAVKWLFQHNYVITRPGRGTFVVDEINPFVVTLSADPKTGFSGGEGFVYVEEAQAQGRKPEDSLPRVEIQMATGRIAQHLGLDEGAQVVSRHQERRIDDKPWSLQTSFYPMTFVERGATELLRAVDIEQGAVSYLREKLGVQQVGYRDVITVRGPNDFESSFFGPTSTGTLPVLETVRTAYDSDGAPLRLTVTVYAGDRNQLAFNIGTVPGQAGRPEVT